MGSGPSFSEFQGHKYDTEYYKVIYMQYVVCRLVVRQAIILMECLDPVPHSMCDSEYEPACHYLLFCPEP